MKKLLMISAIASVVVFTACDGGKIKKTSDVKESNSFISDVVIGETIKSITDSLGGESLFRAERGVAQTAALWRESDGTEAQFKEFCQKNFFFKEGEIKDLFTKIQRNHEILRGYFHKMDVELKEALQLDGAEVTPIDLSFGGYDASAHLQDDLYANKIAFIISLNFPHYSLSEKTKYGEKWSRLEWAYSRMGDMFISRIPADVVQNLSQTLTAADTYISDYNIYMGNLRSEEGEQLFPEDMKLITHWGLRDELKSNYAVSEKGLEKQRMIYSVMKRIIDQSIPAQVINSDEYQWNPVSNKMTKEGKEVTYTSEPDTRYKVLLDNFYAMQKVDAFSPNAPTYIQRAFEEGMEIPEQDVKDLFIALLSSPQVKDVAALIKQRIGRELEPFDIWYNGFRAQSGISEEQLTEITSNKYPNPAAVKADLPNILMKLGWPAERAKQITSLVVVDPSRGAGHAWGAEMRNDVAHLRTRIGAKGMDYKGYNIAVHEFGHNVEQTITMNDVDYYMLNGVPNTSFTEAIAFLFQKRDLDLLGLKQSNNEEEHYLALSAFWNCYEIMGVSLVDMAVWEWMYANPHATPAELKEAVIAAAKDVWNKYYAGILGGQDEPILAVYSHMIDNPLYLSNYPMGHLIDFQIEQQVKGRSLAKEVERMLIQGRIIPQLWMKGAVGSTISVDPVLQATELAVKALKQ